MARFFHPLLQLLACATRQELARQVQYLKIENQILRSKLPKRIIPTPEERRRLVKAGRGLGKAIHELITIVRPATFLGWLNQEKGPKARTKKSTGKPGRPRTPDSVRELIVRIYLLYRASNRYNREVYRSPPSLNDGIAAINQR